MKKIISVFMAILMIFTLMVPAMAAETVNNEAEDYDGYSVIVVRGFDFAGLTYADGTKAISVDIDDIFPILIDTMMARFMLKRPEAVVEGVFRVAEDILAPIACDNEGNSIEDVSMIQYTESMANYPEFTATLSDKTASGVVKAAIEKYGAENTYFFTFDWRKQPSDLAAELNALVETAKRDSGKDKVNIMCSSMGCMVTTAYMYYHGMDSINSAVYLSGAHNGTYVCADALNGRLSVSSDVVYMLVDGLAGEDFVMKILLNIFKSLGAFDSLATFLDDFLAENYDVAVDMFLRDCMGTSCGLWALCQDDDYDSGMETFFGGHEDEYAVVIEKLEKAKEFLFSTEDILDTAMEKGINISFISNYNVGLVPLYDRANLHGDMVIETELTSNFATVAPFGETLSEEYLATADSKYVSADKIIDASTALYKDQTWFVKNASHVAADYGTDYSDLAFTLLESEVQPTIYMFEDYPQFMVADSELSLTPLQ